MSTFIPTTSITVEKPTVGRDRFDDEKHDYSAVANEMPAHIAEARKSAFDPSDGRWHTVTYHKALVPGNFPGVQGWRVTDERTGRKFSVDHVVTAANFVRPGASKTVELTEV